MKNNKKIPINIITGFLGAGKTTAIIHLLKQKKRDEQWAVLINEFGKVSVDFETLSPKASASEKVFEISGGCICCSAKDNFEQNLNEIIGLQKFDRILIEPSGLGGADMISEIIRDKEILDLMPVICLVSIDYLGLERLEINSIFRNQLLKSDILVLSKCDLEPDSEIQLAAFEKLKKEYPEKLHYTKSFRGSIDEKLLNKTFQNIEIPGASEQLIFAGNELTDSNYESICFSFEADKCFNLESLFKIMEKEGKIVRAKGFLNGVDGWYFVNYTLGNSTKELCASKPENKLVVIFEKNDCSFDVTFGNTLASLNMQ